ncbi:MAG: hypothetical protein LHW56_01715 [Candidatus Cloacimonetes bacterium]|nr:hypothetical protein [Candidatus Cloacimonadota bacterium]MDY0171605.1 hypothetical protein [Candidatus Cloacimonadaceae bacterium]
MRTITEITKECDHLYLLEMFSVSVDALRRRQDCVQVPELKDLATTLVDGTTEITLTAE